MRKSHTLVTSALIALGAVTMVAPALVSAPPSSAAESGTAESSGTASGAAFGARWLAERFTPDGFVEGPGGSPAVASTLNSALALAATGVGTPELDAAIEWARGDVESVISVAGNDDPGRIALLLVLLDARGVDPTTFGGVDLPARLLATLGDFEPGLFGAADPTFDGVYRQGLALIGLAAAGVTPPGAAVGWLIDQQCVGAPASAAGGWMSYRADPTVACPAPDPLNFVGPDTNQTALATESLAAIGEEPEVDPLPFLESAQDADGGFAYYPGQEADPNSTALVIQALLARGESLSDWATADGDPLTSLLSWQLGCDAPAADVGAFASPFSSGSADALATEQAVPAAAQRPFPLPRVVPAETPTPCVAPTTTTTTVAPSTTASSVPGPSSTTTSSAPIRPAVAAQAVSGTPAFTG